MIRRQLVFIALLAVFGGPACTVFSDTEVTPRAERDTDDDADVGGGDVQQDGDEPSDADADDIADTDDADGSDIGDDTADGTDDTQSGPNGCGGDEALEYAGEDGAPGLPCGDCGDGVLACAGPNTLRCLRGTSRNECGGCGALDGVAGDDCGVCSDGELVCSGETLDCAGESAPNECGGCGALDGSPGTVCTDGDEPGIWTCTGPSDVICRTAGRNACGGTGDLDEEPGTSCGACGLGRVVCDGTDGTRCADADAGVNGCGGCAPLVGVPGERCGACGGEWTCDGEDAITCDEPARNACGGCSELPGRPGGACGDGGVYFCDSEDALGCGEESNPCGGTEELDGAPGDACGPCGDGTLLCVARNELACTGESDENECGGCGRLAGSPGDSCGPGSVWECSDGRVGCVLDTTRNACGGTAELENAPGTRCGPCESGVFACDGMDATSCAGAIDGEPAEYWRDEDGDGFGDPESTPEIRCAPAAGWAPNDTDCNDDNPSLNPGEDEVCDGIDNDCNDEIDDGLDFETYWPDGDDDGYGDPSGTSETACAPVDGAVANDDDCDDERDAINPDADEVCDGIDNDCDGERDEGLTFVTYWDDEDGDGYGDPESDSVSACAEPPDAAPNDEDCHDRDETINPEADEVCDGIDNDCDGDVDGGLTRLSYWPDLDGDGFGDGTAEPTVSCEPPDGFVPNRDDCDDGEPLANPDGSEECDGIDNNCDGEIDEGFDRQNYWPDADGDNFGDASAEPMSLCSAPSGSVARNGQDCDDADDSISPDADEICDGLDNNCDGEIDEGFDPQRWWPDQDADGYGDDDAEPMLACERPGLQYADRPGDCDDTDASRRPGEIDFCDEVDNDCDGVVDGDLRFGMDARFGRDDDGDGQGSTFDTITACEPPDGYVNDTFDCDDSDPSTYSGAPELCDGADNNCDGIFDDAVFSLGEPCAGAGACGPGSLECSPDETGTICSTEPGGTDDRSTDEVCNGVDDDCDGEVDEPDSSTLCDLPNAEASCDAESGSCLIDSCDDRTADCDGVGSNGCEAELDWNRNACALCGRSCRDGEVCLAGTCKSVGPELIATGVATSCVALSNGEVYCWGADNAGALGNGSAAGAPDRSHLPTKVALDENVIAISAGGYWDEDSDMPRDTVCAVTIDAALYCWGANDRGQVGDGTTTDRFAPRRVSGSIDALSVSVSNGGAHTCAVDAVSGQVYCWGANDVGQLTGVAGDDALEPQVLPDLSDFDTVSAGTEHSCAVTASSEVWCWGNNESRRVDGTDRAMILTPTNVIEGLETPFRTARKVAASTEYTCVTNTANEIYCWGLNSHGQVRQSDEPGPHPASTWGTSATLISHLAVGGQHNCARFASETIQCWGWQGGGRLGNFRTFDRRSGTTWYNGHWIGAIAVDAGGSTAVDKSGHTCAILSNGTVTCAGHNTWGQLGRAPSVYANSGTALPVPAFDAGGALGDKPTCSEFESGLLPQPDCESTWDCDPGTICAADDSGQFCRQVCDPDGSCGSCGDVACQPIVFSDYANGDQFAICESNVETTVSEPFGGCRRDGLTCNADSDCLNAGTEMGNTCFPRCDGGEPCPVVDGKESGCAISTTGAGGTHCGIACVTDADCPPYAPCQPFGVCGQNP